MGAAQVGLPQGPLRSGANDEKAEAIKDAQHQLGTLLMTAKKSLRTRAAAIHPELQPLGFSVLMLLSRNGPVQQVTLTHLLETDKAVISRVIKQLEGLGLISRTVDPADGRALLVALTPEARARYDTSLDEARQMFVDKITQWDVVEVRRFAELLARLNGDTF